MNFNFFNLHDSEKDSNLRQCLRVYGVIPWYLDAPMEKDRPMFEQAWFLHKWLKTTNEKLKKEIGMSWARKWMEMIPYKIKRRTITDWFIGRASPPLIAIEKLKDLGCEKEIVELMKNVEYISSTTGDIIRLPRKPTQDVLYLAGLILGDGCLPNTKKRMDGILIIRFIYLVVHRIFLLN